MSHKNSMHNNLEGEAEASQIGKGKTEITLWEKEIKMMKEIVIMSFC